MSDLLAKLSAPFPPDRISWRVGSTTNDKSKGMALAYIDSRDVQDRLDAVCGADGWQCRYPHASQKTVCEIGVRVYRMGGNGIEPSEEWIWKADGAGDSDVEAEKGALSDAFKRAAVKWGVGRYLYDMDSPWVAIVQKGRSYVIAEHEFARLQKLLPGSKAILAKPEEVDKVKNPPGRSAVVTEVRAVCRDIQACSDGDELLALISTDTFKKFAFKVCCEYPRDWIGEEDNSGLSGNIAQVGVRLGCQNETDAYIHKMERARDEKLKPKQAAE